MKKTVIIDLGTNTFHLLIAEVYSDKTYNIVLKEQVPVKLAEGGIKEGKLMASALERAHLAIDKFSSILNKNNADQIHAFGTSAMRTAVNSDKIVSFFEKNIPAKVEIIDGSYEADLIYYGVRQAVTLNQTPVLMLDIGGGSVEFILCNKNEIIKAESFEIGAARLLDMFDTGNRLKSKSIIEIKSYLSGFIDEYLDFCKQFKPNTLIGASGVFDTFAAIDFHIKNPSSKFYHQYSYNLTLKDYLNIHKLMATSTLQELKLNPVISDFRADMMHVSVILVDYIVKYLAIDSIICSDYAIKEGYLWKTIHEKM